MPGKNKNNRGGRGGGQGGQQASHGGGGHGGGRNAAIKGMIRDQNQELKQGIYSVNTDMFKSATAAANVDVYLNGTVNLLQNLRGLPTHKVRDTAIIKSVVNPSALPDTHMIDLKLNVQGPGEDEVYALFPLLIKNIRRGNTILRVDKAEADSEYVLARKGLEKFFDLRYEFISPEQRFQEASLMSVEHHMQKNYILAGPLRALLQGHKVEVLKTLKANGENVQVSYCKAVQAWCICSKNVALMAKTKSDADKPCYDNPRWSFAREMAHNWFDKLEAIKKEKGEQALEQLKEDMNGRTFVGEYVGSDEHQHLVKYSRVTCIFYAVVDNMSMQDCMPCDEAWALFDKWGLDKVAIQTLGCFSDYASMCDSLCRVFKDVAKSEIAEEEEGNVLYFIKRPAENSNTFAEVLSLTKLKTLEYRLFRKMREKLRNFFARSAEEQTQEKEREIIKKFIRESKELSDEHELPRPLSYYIQLFKTAFSFCGMSAANVDSLNNEYVTFSEKLLEYFATQDTKGEYTSVNSKFFFSPILDIQSNIQYGQGCIQAYELKSGLQDEERKREEVDYDDDSEEESKRPAAQSSQKKSQPESEISDAPLQRNRNQQPKDQRTVLIIVPFGVPGSGKSTVKKLLAEQIATLDPAMWSFDSVSSDEIRADLMTDYTKAGKTKKQAFDATARSGPQAYSRAFGQLCSQAQTGKGKGQTHVIFLDKNHPANGLKRVNDECNKNLKGNIIVKKLYLVPEDVDSSKLNRVKNVPFSENFVCQILAWGQQRTDHETLDNTDPHVMLDVQQMFIKMCKGMVFDEEFLKRNQMDGYLKVPLSVENFELPDSIINTVNMTLNEFAGVGAEANQSNNNALLAELQKSTQALMQFPDKNNQSARIMEQLSRAKDTKVSVVQDPEQEEERKGAQNSTKSSIRTVTDRNMQQSVAATPGSNAKNGKPATFLGINCECDPQYQRKMSQVFQSAFTQSGEPKDMITTFKNMMRQQQQHNPWKFPNSHHVTTLFIGGNRNKLQKPMAEFHQEGKAVDVEIRAVIYIPDKLVAGICFPECEIENEYPHLTLMVSQGWSPVMSNAVIQATCGPKGVFEQAYIAAEDGKRPAGGAGVHTATNVVIDKKGKNEVVFVLLREPITFQGRLKSFY